jgi:DNA-binding MarR family transcriptional regulator
VGKKMIPSILNDALGFNVYRVNLLFRRELMQALSQYEMTPEQWQIMSILWSSETAPKQSDIVRDTLKDKYTLSRIIHRLERDGWVTKTVTAQDRRATEIHLTEKGRSLREEITSRLTGHFGTILKDFKQEEYETLLRLLKKLRGILRDE